MKQLYKKQMRNVQGVKNFTESDFNEETKSAMREARLISEGKIPSKSFESVDELMKDLVSDVND